MPEQKETDEAEPPGAAGGTGGGAAMEGGRDAQLIARCLRLMTRGWTQPPPLSAAMVGQRYANSILENDRYFNIYDNVF